MLPVWLIIGLATVMIGVWYASGRLVYFWDQTFPLNPMAALKALFHIWHGEYDFGRIDVTAIAFIPYVALITLFYAITSSLVISQAIYFWLILVFAGVGFYRFGLMVLGYFYTQLRWRHVAASLIAALFYLFNPYVIFYLWRIPNTYAMLYALLPVLITVGVRYISWGSMKDLSLAIILFVMMSPGLSNPSLLPVLMLIPFFTLILPRVDFRKKIQRIIPLGFLCILSVTFWLVPVATNIRNVASAGSYGGVKEALLQNSKNLQISNTLRLLGESPITETLKGERAYTWVDFYTVEKNPIISVVPLLPIAMTTLALALGWNTSRRWIFFTVAVFFSFSLFIFFAKGAAFPFSKIFLLLFDNISAFEMFRDPFPKFGLGALYLLSTLFTLSIPVVVSYCQSKKTRNIIMILLAICVISYGWPLLSGQVFRTGTTVRPTARVHIPQDYFNVASIVSLKSSPGQRLLSFPKEPYPLMSETWENGYVGYDPIRLLTLRPVISTANTSKDQTALIKALYDSMNEQDSEKVSATVLANLGVKWLLIRKATNTAFTDEKVDIASLEQKMSHTRNIEEVYNGQYLRLYAVKDTLADYYIPKRVFLSDVILPAEEIVDSLKVRDSIVVSKAPENIVYEQHAHVQQNGGYLDITDAKGDIFIASHEAFSQQWVLLFGDRKIAPITTNGAQTGWWINVESLCHEEGLCKRQDDELYALRVQPKFLLQKQASVCFIVSAVVVGIAVSTFIFHTVKSSRRHLYQLKHSK